LQERVDEWRKNGAQVTDQNGVRSADYAAITRRQRSYTRAVEVYLRKNKLEAGNKNSVTAVDIAESTLKVLRRILKVHREIRDIARYQVSHSKYTSSVTKPLILRS
jgi:hypothetical protein